MPHVVANTVGEHQAKWLERLLTKRIVNEHAPQVTGHPSQKKLRNESHAFAT
jgi:hypothetical protein